MTTGDKAVRRPNPFQPAPGADPPRLAGRGAELAAIADATGRAAVGSAPTPIVFLGLRGLGKTVLLHQIPRKGGTRAVHLALEVQSGVPLATSLGEEVRRLRPALKRLPSRIEAALEAALRLLPLPKYEFPHDLGAIALAPPPDALPEAFVSIAEALRSVNEAAQALGRYLVITVDEAQDADLLGLQAIVTTVHQSASTKQPILFAAAGLPQMRNMLKQLRTYTSRWDRFELRFLTRGEVVEAIRKPIVAAGLRIDDGAVDLLTEECAGYPYFVQKFASAAWSHHRGDRITTADARAVIPGVRATLEGTFYAEIFAGLTPREKQIVLALAELGSGAHPLGALAQQLGVGSHAFGSTRTRLIAKEVIFAPSPGMIQFRIPLAERYIRARPEVFAVTGTVP